MSLKNLCEKVILEDFGPLAKDIVSLLFRKARQNLQEIFSHFSFKSHLEPAIWRTIDDEQKRLFRIHLQDFVEKEGGLTENVHRQIQETCKCYVSELDLKLLFGYLSQDQQQRETNARICHVLKILIQHHCITLSRDRQEEQNALIYDVDPDFIELRPKLCRYVALQQCENSRSPIQNKIGEISIIITLFIVHGRLTRSQAIKCFRRDILVMLNKNREIEATTQIIEECLESSSEHEYREACERKKLPYWCRDLFAMQTNLRIKKIATQLPMRKGSWISQLNTENENLLHKAIDKHGDFLWKYLKAHNYIQNVPALDFEGNIDLPNLADEAKEENLLFPGKLSIPAATSMKKKKERGSEQYRINHQRFLIDQRRDRIARYYNQRINREHGAVGRILGTLLDQRFSTGLEIEDQVKNSSENRFWVRNLQKENSMKVKEIQEYIDEDNLNIEKIENICQFLSQADPNNFIPRVLNCCHGGGSYAANVSELIKEMCTLSAQKVVETRYGPEAARIFRLLQSKKRLTQTQIAKYVRTENKQTQQILFNLLRDDWAQLTELSDKKESRNKKDKSIFGWSIRWESVRYSLIDSLRNSWVNLAQKRQALLIKHREITQELKNIGDALGEKRKLQEKLLKCIETLQLHLTRIDDDLALFRFF